eukprot:TRINITY_DN22656_c0_g1_i2.p1 TRINITY_DN22656_c0_g1~~TRINITY_DN22656_c0_g1_i2.p1  ORF type:complete len:214 (-),score=40.40 TRINITY_DN22656_c0_g1_i2:496-1137(-)
MSEGSADLSQRMVALSLGGCPGAGTCVRRMACFQAGGQIFSAARVPAVQERATEVCQSAKEHIKTGLENLGVDRFVHDAKEGLVNCIEDLRQETGLGDTCWPRPALERPKENTTEETGQKLVRIHGLNGAKHLNGRIGRVVGTHEETGRLKVCLLTATPLRFDEAGTGGSPSTNAAKQSQQDDAGEVKLIQVWNLEDPAMRSDKPPAGGYDFI